jgi:poly-gamma-glutamate capsule biosynthesis protein CapA/YwtB (metallophosphatase superfamily)
MKILITGDISTDNIDNFELRKISGFFKDLIHKSDLVVYNLEGPITSSREFTEKHKIQFRENKISNTVYSLVNNLNTSIRKKPQIKVFSEKEIFSLLNLNKNTLVTLANNHIKDLGKEGFKYTIRELEKNQIKYIGAGNNLNQTPNFYEFNNIVFINLNLIGTYKFRIPVHLYSASRNNFGAYYISLNILKKKIDYLKKNNKKVILVIHGGKELPRNINKLNLDLNKIRNLNSDITVIHHPHIYLETKYEKDNIFILGDFIFKSSNKRLKSNRKSSILEVLIKNNKVKTNLIKFKINKVYKYD